MTRGRPATPGRRSKRLEIAREWADSAGRRKELSQFARDFLDASLAADAVARRRRRSLVATAMAMVLLASSAIVTQVLLRSSFVLPRS